MWHHRCPLTKCRQIVLLCALACIIRLTSYLTFAPMLQQQTAGCLEQPMTGQDNDTVAEGWVPPSNNHQPSFHKCRKGKQLTAHRFKWQFHIGFHESESLGNSYFKMSITVCMGVGGAPKSQYHLCLDSFSIFNKYPIEEGHWLAWNKANLFLIHKLWY